MREWGENDRGVSFTFGPDVVSAFLKRHDLDLVVRAHQVVEDGYEFFARRQLVTVFSAPNYCGEFDNAGAMMSVDETLMCSFQILKPADKRPRYTYVGIEDEPSVGADGSSAGSNAGAGAASMEDGEAGTGALKSTAGSTPAGGLGASRPFGTSGTAGGRRR